MARVSSGSEPNQSTVAAAAAAHFQLENSVPEAQQDTMARVV
jgi:hypothetical protein